jgi:peroxiredoxin
MITKLTLWLISIAFTSTAYALKPGIKLYHEPIKAPEFILSDLNNNIHRISDYRNSVVIINFWATWCMPCRKEIPLLQTAWKRLKNKNIYLLGVATKDSPEDVRQFKKKHGIQYPSPIDETGSVADNWSVSAVPVAFVIDKGGLIAMRIVGGNEWSNPELIDSIIALTNRPAGQY